MGTNSEKNAYMCITESLFCTTEINTTLPTNYPSIQKGEKLKREALGVGVRTDGHTAPPSSQRTPHHSPVLAAPLFLITEPPLLQGRLATALLPLESPRKKESDFAFNTHERKDRKGAARTAKQTLLANRRLVSVAGTRSEPVPARSTEFQKGSEGTQGLLTVGRRQEDRFKGCPVAARPLGPVLPPGSWVTLLIPIP